MLLPRESMADADDPASPRPRALPLDASGRTYALGRTDARETEIDELGEHIAPFIVSIWTSMLDLPLAADEPRGRSSDGLSMRVTVPLSGHRWIRIACGPELSQVIGSHVFGQPIAGVDVASSRMAVLELASAIAKHAAVIEHPAWPWTAGGEHSTSAVDRTTACELWFECRGHLLAVALLCRPDPRSTG